jgi:carboxyl-terminal processing protease
MEGLIRFPARAARAVADLLLMRRLFAARGGVLLMIGMLASACGGGGGGGGSGNSGDYQPGVFAASADFAGRCAVPRQGIDPSTNLAYVDRQGSVNDENQFLRSFSDETYLWYDEIIDRDPRLFNNPLDYFGLLKTTAITPSGQLRDKFHFTLPSAEWFQLAQSGVSVGYGATFVTLSAVPPREFVIGYTEPNSPATQIAVPLARGARILAIDGVGINTNTQTGIDTLNAGLFPESAGEMHSFEISDFGSAGSRIVNLTAENVVSSPVQHVKVLPTAMGNVGYLLFNDHIATAELALINAVNQLNAGPGITDLVIDLRYNGGGFLDIASQFAYMIAGPAQTGTSSFETLQFNDKHPSINPITGQLISPTPFYATAAGFSAPAGLALPTLDLARVFVLTGPGTCSASESIINSLRGIGVEVIQIGSTTCGKPYGFYPEDNCGTTYFTIQFRGANDVGFGDYSDGFSPQNTVSNRGEVLPGCSVKDDFNAALGDPSEARLAAALAYRANPSACPLASGRPLPGTPSASDGILHKSPWLSNRILR